MSMNFGIVGAGMIANFHAKAIHAMATGKLKGVAARSKEQTAKLANEHATIAYSSIDEMLADPEIDIITIATPSGAHLEPALAAIEAGKHVAIEKPLEVTTDRIDQILDAASRKGVTVSAILNRRFCDAVSNFKEAMNSKRLGTVTSASAYIKWYRNQAYYDSAAWRGTWALDGGGALMNQSIHTIDNLLHLAGPVKTVQARTACLAHDNIEVEDAAVAQLVFTSGALGVIEGSTCNWSSTGHPARIQVCGTEGSIFMADDAFEIWDFLHEQPEDQSIRDSLMLGKKQGMGANDPKAISYEQHQRNFEEIVASIIEKRAPTTSGTEARRSVRLIEAIYQSAQNGGAAIEIE